MKTLIFLLGLAMGATATLTYMHATIKRQVARQDEVLARAEQAREYGKTCRVALETVWSKIEAGRVETARRMED